MGHMTFTKEPYPWTRVFSDPSPRPKPCLFLDRDGVIIEDCEYLSDPENVRLLPGIVDLMALARQKDAFIVQVTNQSGVARGYFTDQEFIAVENRLAEKLSSQDVQRDAVYACPYHKDGQPPYQHAAHPWRKPHPGMIYAAAEDLNIDLSKSVIVGDSARDIEAGLQAGLCQGLHVLTGHGERERVAALRFQRQAYRVTTHATAHAVCRHLMSSWL